ncbi:hypothetical protein HK098_008002, partial [Nowakowskiella sp. JEL0407]
MLAGIGNYGSIVKFPISRRALQGWPIELPPPVITVYPTFVHRYKSAMPVSSYSSLPKKVNTIKKRISQLESLLGLLFDFLILDDDCNIIGVDTEKASELTGFRIEISIKQIPIKSIFDQLQPMIEILKGDFRLRVASNVLVDEDLRCRLAQTMNMLGISNPKWKSNLKSKSLEWWKDRDLVSDWLPVG